MEKQLTIGQLGAKVGLSTKTIRFYEATGLIASPNRAENGYRQYTRQTIKELSLIKYARDLGLPIPQIKKLMKGCEGSNCKHSEEYVEREIDDYLKVLNQKITEQVRLKQKLMALRHSISDCKNKDTNTEYCCNILGQLANLKPGKEVR